MRYDDITHAHALFMRIWGGYGIGAENNILKKRPPIGDSARRCRNGCVLLGKRAVILRISSVQGFPPFPSLVKIHFFSIFNFLIINLKNLILSVFYNFTYIMIYFVLVF